MLTDLPLILRWWFIFFLLGWVALPLTTKLLGQFWDRGYALSKILGLALVGYPVWLLASLKILPFTTEAIWLIIICVFIFNYFVVKTDPKLNWRVFLFEEIIFLVCLVAWSFVRGFQPDIQGLEKFMDYGFMQSILKSTYFPPADMWFAGSSINYYYFGHYLAALLTKLSGIDPTVTYNLQIAALFALCFSAAFTLGANLITRQLAKLAIINGFLTAGLVTLGGNLHVLYTLLAKGNLSQYWYPDATRFIVKLFGAADNTIHEFPLYSFVVADLHGHVSNLPFVLFFLACLLSILYRPKLNYYPIILLSLFLAIFYMSNTWDVPIYLAIMGLVLWLKTKSFVRSGLLTISCLLLALLLALPFILNFKNISGGPTLADFHSPPWMLIVLWGLPFFSSIIFIIVIKFTKLIKVSPVDYFVLILLGWSWFLILLPEIIYVKDIYIHEYQRANTMFKLTYQAFVMFALAESYIFFRILTVLKTRRIMASLFTISYLLLAIFVFLYPSYALRSYYGLKDYKGLYGLNFLKHYPDDYQAILWLKKNVPGQPVILEAVGESYTDFGRASTFAGLPAVLGWRVHEWLWRGSWDLPGQRSEEAKEIYEGSDARKTRELLKKYHVQYIFIGQLETQQYPQIKLNKLFSLGKIIYSSGKTTILQINQ
ncbi:MAG: DUF2298 domain-containing protein [Candidatus Shapirobacteria bacterium]